MRTSPGSAPKGVEGRTTRGCERWCCRKRDARRSWGKMQGPSRPRANGYNSQMPDAVEFHWDKGKVQVLVLGAGIVGAFGIVLLFQDDIGAKALGVAWIAAFLALARTLLRRRNDPEPVVVIDARGISDRRISDHVLPWEEILLVNMLEAENLTFVGIDLQPDASVLKRFGTLHRLTRWPNRILRFPTLSISMHPLNGTPSDLLAAIMRFRPNLVAK